MAHKVIVYSLVLIFILKIVMVDSATYDKKTLDGMVLKMLWTKVFLGHEPKVKEGAIKKLKKTGDYDKLIHHLIKLKKEKVPHVLNLLAEIIITYMAA